MRPGRGLRFLSSPSWPQTKNRTQVVELRPLLDIVAPALGGLALGAAAVCHLRCRHRAHGHRRLCHRAGGARQLVRRQSRPPWRPSGSSPSPGERSATWSGSRRTTSASACSPVCGPGSTPRSSPWRPPCCGGAPGGDLLTRIVADIETLEQLACQRDDAGRRGRPRRDRGLALFDPALGLVLAAATVLIGLAVPLAARRAARAAARVQVAARSDLAAALVNVVQGPSDLLALRRERAFLAALTRLAGGWSGPTAGRRHHVRHAPRLARPRPRSRPRVLLPHRDESEDVVARGGARSGSSRRTRFQPTW